MMRAMRALRVGLIVGLIGYLSVAAFYALFDLLAARGALYTVDLLGKAMVLGLRDPSILGLPIQIDLEAVLWYNIVHLTASLTIGLVVIGLVEDAIRNPSKSRLIFFTFVLGFVVTVGVITVLTDPIRALLPWWSIVVANALAAGFAAIYVVHAYPGIWAQLSPFSPTPEPHKQPESGGP